MNYNKLYIDAINVLTRIMSSDYIKKHNISKHPFIKSFIDRFDFHEIVDIIYFDHGMEFDIEDLLIYIKIRTTSGVGERLKYIFFEFSNTETNEKYGNLKFKNNEILKLLCNFKEKIFNLTSSILDIKDGKLNIEINNDCKCPKFFEYEFECYCEDGCRCLLDYNSNCKCNCECYKRIYKEYQFYFLSNLELLNSFTSYVS